MSPARGASIARSIARRGSLVLLGTLGVVGLLTAILLVIQARAAEDEALLAAAHAYAEAGGQGESWEVERSRTHVEVRAIRPGDNGLPRAMVRRVIEEERPRYLTRGGRRLLLLPAEVEHQTFEEDEEHLVVLAEAPALTALSVVGPFGVIYLPLSLLAAGVAAVLDLRLARKALLPVQAAGAQARRVVSLGQGLRLEADAPEELQPLITEMNGALDRLDNAFRAQARFTDEAAHELRTPVTVLLGEIELALRKERSAEEYRAALSTLHEQVLRMRDLVEALMGLARLDAGQVEEHREKVDASGLLEQAVAAERAGLEAAGNELSMEIHDDTILSVHPGLVGLALRNLIRNAARHAPGTPVRVGLHLEGGQAVFVVEDEGPGVKEPEALFDRFARSGTARRKDREGLGLGLSLAREAARRHGGDCRLESRHGGGCRAVLTLPAQALIDF